MTSHAQKKRGYLNPIVQPTETRCIKITIPDDDVFREAVFAQLTELYHWWSWRRDDNFTAKETAQTWRSLFALEEDCGIMNCEDVIACLEASIQWNSLISLVNGHTVEIGDLVDENQDQQDEIDRQREQPTDGNTYPPAPTVQTSDACGAAWFIVEQFRAWIAAFELAADEEVTIFDALDAVWNLDPHKLGDVVGDLMRDLYGNVVSVLPDYDANAEAMREELYCNNNTMSNFGAWLTANGLSSIKSYLDCLTQSTWDRWTYLGSFDNTRDCSEYCYTGLMPIMVHFDAGSYADYGILNGTIQAGMGNGGNALRRSNTCANCSNNTVIEIYIDTPELINSISVDVYTRFSTITWSIQMFNASNAVVWSVGGNPVTTPMGWTTLSYSGLNVNGVNRIRISNGNGAGGAVTTLDNRIDNIVIDN